MRYRALVAFAIGLAAVGAARAQGAPKVTLMPSAAVECLLPSPLQRGLPEYPFEEYKRAIGGEVKVALVNHGKDTFVIRRGERIAQLLIAPVARAAWLPVASLDTTDRGTGGYGSTGR